MYLNIYGTENEGGTEGGLETNNRHQSILKKTLNDYKKK